MTKIGRVPSSAVHSVARTPARNDRPTAVTTTAAAGAATTSTGTRLPRGDKGGHRAPGYEDSSRLIDVQSL
jgi:hypothetical protein